MRRKLWKQGFSLAMAAAMTVSMIPSTAVAAATEEGSISLYAESGGETIENARYVMMNVPYQTFYKAVGLKNSVDVDIVSSATANKARNCSNVYYESENTVLEGGTDIKGVTVPVALDETTYEAVKDLVTKENADYYMTDYTGETDPSVYLKAEYVNGNYQFTFVAPEETTEEAQAELESSTVWGDYQLNLTDSSKGQSPANVYGAYITAEKTERGQTTVTQYAMKQGENLWTPSNYYEFAWSTGVKKTEAKGGILHSAHYESMEGQTITSITYITTSGKITYNLKDGLYVTPHYKKASAVSATLTSSTSVTVANLPKDIEDAKVTVTTGGKGATLLATKAEMNNGNVTLDAAPEDGKEYKVVVYSSNYAAIEVSLNVTVLMNVPYEVFYETAGIEDEEAVDIVSSATTSKVGNCSNVYSNSATITNGMDLNGVVIPVKMDIATYNDIKDAITEKNADYYISGIQDGNPSVYLNLTEYNKDKGYTFTANLGKENYTRKVKATITSNTTWGDYQVNLDDSDMGFAPSDVYGAYFTMTDGSQYVMRQSENLWTPSNYYEFSWSTGVQTTDVHGGILHSDYYKSMEGKTISEISYITKSGVETYKLASGLYVAPHYNGTVSAGFASDKSVKVYGISGLKDVTVDIYTGTRAKTYLAQNAKVVNGEVAISGAIDSDAEYTIVVNSSNYAAATAVVGTDLASCSSSLSATSYTYDGNAKKPNVTVKNGAATLEANTDYTVSYKNNTNAGTATVTITGKGKYAGTITKTFKIAKASQTISAQVPSKTYKYATVKKKNQTFKIGASAKTDLSYKSSNTKNVTVTSKGVVTVKKKAKKGTYYVTVSAKSTTNYNAASKQIKIVVK